MISFMRGGGPSITGLMQEMTSDGKFGRYPKSRLLKYIGVVFESGRCLKVDFLGTCLGGSTLFGNDTL